ncbi:phosphonate monoester hydrolase [Loktanella sp. IMCC34160]|uniref:sulfatase-like hydrolase/transferase n=1 Tax=Loktanella sp. IMCC34160 TaxID=2510646 RepID=UPI00101C171D|nr:sulfatase-like hydrolase/transferase [Loktanella sp. IMCC34160]RYG90311.1 phosphonate monoester hydrolase [Loktanella sp. IMCC34160]
MSQSAKNILFIMYDQLRFDYLSCAGHPHLHTPNFDRLAALGVRFTRAYVQSPVCGASRMSTYTGRYMSSHGAQWNNFPLKVGEMTLGDHLRPLGMETWLIGKTHMKADFKGMDRLGISRDGVIGARVAECGFDIWVRDDGLHAEGPDGPYDTARSPYNEYLRQKGYAAENPWHDNANAGVDDDGNVASGFLMANAVRPANVATEDSETPWLTDRTIDFIEARDGAPWCAHVSFIKPHWPYIVPAPYNDMFGPQHVLPANRSDAEKADPHPVFAGFMDGKIGRTFQRDDVREAVIPAYMGLIKQCDDELGRLLDYLGEKGLMDDTMIVLTSDHGDYLGDHWMGEKDLFHDASVKVPMIIYDPSPEADKTRGTTCDALVEQIDLAPTFVEVAGGPVPDHILEGRSLLPLLHGERPAWRKAAISEYDWSLSEAAKRMGLAPRECRLFMVATERWKFMHAEGGFRPMLFDLETDPQELVDLGASPDHAGVIDEMYDLLFTWARRMSQRTTVSEPEILARRQGGSARRGILLGVFDENDVADEMLVKYRGPAKPIPARG